MANTVISDTVTLPLENNKLVDKTTVCTTRLTAGPDNVGDVTITLPLGGSYKLGPRSCSELYISIDLHDFDVTGTAGDKITYDGGTW